jgi:hypothetical protein
MEFHTQTRSLLGHLEIFFQHMRRACESAVLSMQCQNQDNDMR